MEFLYMSESCDIISILGTAKNFFSSPSFGDNDAN